MIGSLASGVRSSLTTLPCDRDHCGGCQQSHERENADTDGVESSGICARVTAEQSRVDATRRCYRLGCGGDGARLVRELEGPRGYDALVEHVSSLGGRVDRDRTDALDAGVVDGVGHLFGVLRNRQRVLVGATHVRGRDGRELGDGDDARLVREREGPRGDGILLELVPRLGVCRDGNRSDAIDTSVDDGVGHLSGVLRDGQCVVVDAARVSRRSGCERGDGDDALLARELEGPRGHSVLVELKAGLGGCLDYDVPDAIDTSVGDGVGHLSGVLGNVQLVIADTTLVHCRSGGEGGDDGDTRFVDELEGPRLGRALLEDVPFLGSCRDGNRSDAIDPRVGDGVGHLVGVLRNVQLVVGRTTGVFRRNGSRSGDNQRASLIREREGPRSHCVLTELVPRLGSCLDGDRAYSGDTSVGDGVGDLLGVLGDGERVVLDVTLVHCRSGSKRRDDDRARYVRELEGPRRDGILVELETCLGGCLDRDRSDALDPRVVDGVGHLVGVLRNVQRIVVDTTHIRGRDGCGRGNGDGRVAVEVGPRVGLVRLNERNGPDRLRLLQLRPVREGDDAGLDLVERQRNRCLFDAEDLPPQPEVVLAVVAGTAGDVLVDVHVHLATRRGNRGVDVVAVGQRTVVVARDDVAVDGLGGRRDNGLAVRREADLSDRVFLVSVTPHEERS